MHYYLIEVCILILIMFFSFPLVYFVLSTVCPYSFPPSSGELIWPLLTGLLAENSSWTAGDNKAVLEGAGGSFWFRNTTDGQITLSEEWLGIHLHTVSGLLSTSQASLCFYKQGWELRNRQGLFLTESQRAILIPVCWHFTQCSLHANHSLFHNWMKYKLFSILFYTKRLNLDDFCW